MLGSLILAGLFAVAGWWLLAGDQDAESNVLYAGSSGPSPEATSAAPAAAVRDIHQALHSIGRECRLPPAARGKAAIDADVRTILRFVRRYPTGRFPIDDETGSPLSLLLVTRQALVDCSPRNAALVDAALPPAQRGRGSPTAPAR